MEKNAGLKKFALAAGMAVCGLLILHGVFRLFARGSFLGSLGEILIGAGLLILLAQIVRKPSAKKTQQPQVSLLSEKPRTIRQKVNSTRPKAFKKEMRELENQALRMEKKSEQLDRALQSYFGASRISYEKFAGTINGVIRIFDDNVTRILSRIDIFDEDGYEHLFKTHQEYTDAIAPYQESFRLVREDLERNDEILERMDRLMKEVNSLTDSQKDLKDLPAMQELAELTEQTELYRQNQY